MEISEVWKDIPLYQGYYQISSFSRVRSVDRVIETSQGPRIYRGKVMNLSDRRQTTKGRKWLSVRLSKKSFVREFYIHVLMEKVFHLPRTTTTTSHRKTKRYIFDGTSYQRKHRQKKGDNGRY